MIPVDTSIWLPAAPCVPVSSVTSGWKAQAAAGSRAMHPSALRDKLDMLYPFRPDQ